MIITVIALIFSNSSLWAQDISGKWSNKDNPNDSIIISISSNDTEFLTAQFIENGKKYAEAIGYFRDGKITFAFRRTNTRDIGFVTFILRNPKTADSRSFNPDGSQRWQGVYLR
jgi:hypothetical protein